MPVSPDRILFSDDHLLIVSKLASELAVRGRGEVGKLPLYDFLHQDYPGLRVVHRLDFETSGVIVFAKSKAALDAILTSEFSGWKKTYRAIVAGHLPLQKGVIRAALPARSGNTRNTKPALRLRSLRLCSGQAGQETRNSPFDSTPFDSAQGKQGKQDKKLATRNSQLATRNTVPAITHYSVLSRFSNATYVECVIDTGRYHQIRRHFASIGHPLALDDVYGDKRFNMQFARATRYRKFFLHAYRLGFPHPITHTHLEVIAPLPRAFEDVLQKL